MHLAGPFHLLSGSVRDSLLRYLVWRSQLTRVLYTSHRYDCRLAEHMFMGRTHS